MRGGAPSNKELKLTKPEHIGASQLNSSVGPTYGGAKMAVTDAAYIQSLTKQLDEAVPREGHVEVFPDPNDMDYRLVRANQLGYLRLGIEFLKAAYVSPESGGKDTLLKLDLGYLEGLGHYSFERREDVWSPISSDEPASAISQIVGWLIGAFFVASLLIGAFSIVRWLFNAVV